MRHPSHNFPQRFNPSWLLGDGLAIGDQVLSVASIQLESETSGLLCWVHACPNLVKQARDGLDQRRCSAAI
jgi:hypothetical protein